MTEKICVSHDQRVVFSSPSQSCSDCPVPRLAQSLCTLCNKWLCYQCTNMHQHHRPLATSQYADLDLHQQPPPPNSHCPDGTHQRGPGPLALPTAESGKHHHSPPRGASRTLHLFGSRIYRQSCVALSSPLLSACRLLDVLSLSLLSIPVCLLIMSLWEPLH